MSAVGITENVKGDNKKFEVWYNGREEVYIIQASSIELKNLWVSEIRKVLTGQLEACREASQLHQRITESVYHAPMRNSSSTRYSRKSASVQNKSDLSSPETSKNKNRANSPNTRQKRGPLGPDVKAKRHEIKSDPTPFGFEEVFGKSLLVQSECKNSNNSRSTRQVPRSTSQTAWPNRQFPSLDTYEDFETIPSSNDELSNSSDMDEDIHTNNAASLFRVNGSFDTCYPESFTLQHGDLVQFIQGGENAQWLVKEIVSQKTFWVPSSLLYPAEGDRNNSSRDAKTDTYRDTSKSSLPATTEARDLKNEATKGSTTHQSVVS